MDVCADLPKRPASVWPCLVLCAVLACWIDFGRIHREHHGDSVLPVLVSLYRWTPFYWGQNRLGMLLPLLARPFHDPVTNLMVQTGLSVFSGLAGVFLLCRYALRGPGWPAAAVVAAATLLLLLPAWLAREYLRMHQPYGLSLALGLGALILAEVPPGGPVRRGRLAAAAVLMLLAHWVNLALAAVLGPLVVFRYLLGRRTETRDGTDPAACGRPARQRARTLHGNGGLEPALALVLLGLGYAGGTLVAWLAPHHNPEQTAGMPAANWLPAWGALAGSGWESLGFACRLAWVVALAVVLPLAFIPAVRRELLRALRSCGALVLGALAYFLFLGTRKWMLMNDYSVRYLLPCLVLVHTAVVVAVVVPLWAGWGRRARRWVSALGGPALLVVTAWVWGVPSLRGVRADLDQSLGTYTADVLRAGCTHVAGDYWTVWPTVFHTNLVLREHGRRDLVWGVTARCEDTVPRWCEQLRWDQLCVGFIGHDDLAAHLMHHYLPYLRSYPSDGHPFTAIWRVPPPGSAADGVPLDPR
jgi:hypothetical protein